MPNGCHNDKKRLEIETKKQFYLKKTLKVIELIFILIFRSIYKSLRTKNLFIQYIFKSIFYIQNVFRFRIYKFLRLQKSKKREPSEWLIRMVSTLVTNQSLFQNSNISCFSELLII